jgi:LPXTG-motif cell wall-anchored protein
VAPDEQGLVLPQGGTDMRLLLLLGALSLSCGLFLLRRSAR